MRRAEWTTAEELRVGVVGSPANVGSLGSGSGPGPESESDFDFDFESTLERATADTGATVVSGSATAVLERSPSFVVCLGQEALTAVVHEGITVPVLPIDVGPGLHSVTGDRLHDTLEAVFAGDGCECQYPLLCVESESIRKSNTGPIRACFDVALLTEEPARISEYSVRSRGNQLAQFRADGVVVATPQGSHGYATAAGGPLIAPGLDALAVVPVAPFVTRTQQWIVPNDDLELTVERDEGPVSLQVDDRTLETVTMGSTVSITADESLTVLCPSLE